MTLPGWLVWQGWQEGLQPHEETVLTGLRVTCDCIPELLRVLQVFPCKMGTTQAQGGWNGLSVSQTLKGPSGGPQRGRSHMRRP